MPKVSSNSEYAVLGLILALLLVILYFTVPVFLEKDYLPADVRWIGVLLAVPFLALHYMVYRLMRRSDEFLRTVMAKRLIVTTLLVMPLTGAYGLAQSFLHAPVIPITFAAVVFWVIYAIVCLFVRSSRVPTFE